MTDALTIDRIVARTPEADGVTARVERIIRRVAEDRLDQLLGGSAIAGQGEWCLPSVSVAAVLDLERPDSALEESVARAVLDAIVDALHGSAVVHYPGAVDALAGLVVAAAARRCADAWMWARIGLIDDADELSREPTACVLRALERRPECVVAALVRAVRAAGFAAVHRLLAEPGWIRLASTVIDACVGACGGAALRSMLIDVVSPDAPVDGGRTADVTITPAPAQLRAASRIVAASALAGAVRGSRLRLPASMVRALSVFSVAESEPATLYQDAAVPVCRAAACIIAGSVRAIAEIDGSAVDRRPRGRQPLAAAAPGTTVAVPSESRGSAASVGADRPSDGTSRQTADAETALAQPSTGHPVDANIDAPPAEPAAGIETAWAGLLFLLNAARDAGMPETLLTDPVLDGIAATELLARVALALVPIVEDDPVVFAFAGADPHRTRCTWDLPLTGAPADRIDTHAAAWAAAVAHRLDREDDPARCVADMGLRTGTIEREPGWMDIHLDLQSVDLDVRRAGLDIDPGWVPWLGSVVRFRYA